MIVKLKNFIIMKKEDLNIILLSEKEQQEVKGGHVLEGTDPDDMNFCPKCAWPITDLEYNKLTGIYTHNCPNCGTVIDIAE